MHKTLRARTKKNFVSGRPAPAARKFVSPAVEAQIQAVKQRIKDPELAWMFENCCPNTLDTTVEVGTLDGKPDTYVITGDMDAMWLRDSSAQVWPYLPFIQKDPALENLVMGVVNRQARCVLLDPYANAFLKDTSRTGNQDDLPLMKPGVHERKWELDSLCYVIRLAHGYWKAAGNTACFDAQWLSAMKLIVQTFKEQQRQNGGYGPYSFKRKTTWATETSSGGTGAGNLVKPVGLICSVFRPSDDGTIFPFLIPSNFFAVVSLRQLADMVRAFYQEPAFAAECVQLADEVHHALQEYATVTHKVFGEILAYEVDGFGGHYLADDANVPSLLSLPYINPDMRAQDKALYARTRRFFAIPWRQSLLCQRGCGRGRIGVAHGAKHHLAHGYHSACHYLGQRCRNRLLVEATQGHARQHRVHARVFQQRRRQQVLPQMVRLGQHPCLANSSSNSRKGAPICSKRCVDAFVLQSGNWCGIHIHTALGCRNVALGNGLQRCGCAFCPTLPSLERDTKANTYIDKRLCNADIAASAAFTKHRYMIGSYWPLFNMGYRPFQ